MLKKHGATLNFTCAEMRTMNEQMRYPEALVDPEGLVWQVSNMRTYPEAPIDSLGFFFLPIYLFLFFLIAHWMGKSGSIKRYVALYHSSLLRKSLRLMIWRSRHDVTGPLYDVPICIHDTWRFLPPMDDVPIDAYTLKIQQTSAQTPVSWMYSHRSHTT